MADKWLQPLPSGEMASANKRTMNFLHGPRQDSVVD